MKLDNGLVHGAAQKSAALVCLIGIGKINLYNLHLSPCHLWRGEIEFECRAGQAILTGTPVHAELAVPRGLWTLDLVSVSTG